MTWKPSNRCCVRVCTTLHVANRLGDIVLSYDEASRVHYGCFQTRFAATTKVYLWKLWMKSGGLGLAKEIDRYSKIPSDVLKEMKEQEKTG